MSVDPLSRLDPKHVVLLKGKPHPVYAGVLAAAMEAGLLELSVKLIQAPNEDNGGMAICSALARFPGVNGQDRIFEEIGDCDKDNCTPHIAPHRVRMAATRAKGRALRDALGIGVALAEEMSDGREDGMAQAQPASRANGPAQGGTRRPVAQERGAAAGPPPGVVGRESDVPICSVSECGTILTRDEISGSFQRGWPPLCTTHGKERKAAERAAQDAAATA